MFKNVNYLCYMNVMEAHTEKCTEPYGGTGLLEPGSVDGLVLLPDVHAFDLAADGLGQFLDELDYTGVLVRGGVVLGVHLELLLQFVGGLVAVPEDDRRLDELSPDGVRDTGDRALEDRGVLQEHALDLEGTDPVTG